MTQIFIKTPEQIEGIKKASKLTAMTLDMIGKYIKPGVSTLELDNIMNTFILSNWGKSACIDYLGNNKWGKWPTAYKRCTCISINDVICHWVPRADEILKEWDILNIDVTTTVDGYFGDSSRMYTVGNVTDTAKKLVDDARFAMEVGISQVFPGNQFGNIGYAISEYAEGKWYSVVREYGWHGVGIAFHEEPFVFHKANKNTGPKMKPGMIFTIEPMLNLGKFATKIDKDNWTVRTKDWSLSAQWEHTILVTEDGYEILTKSLLEE